jgi:peptidoglycan LD-endopeptidase LytH
MKALLLVCCVSSGVILSGCNTTINKQSHPSVDQRTWLSQQRLPRQLPVPVKGVERTKLNDTWGAARSGGRRHEGIDIFAKIGTPILSTTEGVIQKISTGGLGGNAIWVLGPELTRHYYAHLDKFGRFKVGDRVKMGDKLGTVGDTGNAKGTSPHLHYGIYRANGQATNPYNFLSSR